VGQRLPQQFIPITSHDHRWPIEANVHRARFVDLSWISHGSLGPLRDCHSCQAMGSKEAAVTYNRRNRLIKVSASSRVPKAQPQISGSSGALTDFKSLALSQLTAINRHESFTRVARHLVTHQLSSRRADGPQPRNIQRRGYLEQTAILHQQREDGRVVWHIAAGETRRTAVNMPRAPGAYEIIPTR